MPVIMWSFGCVCITLARDFVCSFCPLLINLNYFFCSKLLMFSLSPILFVSFYFISIFILFICFYFIYKFRLSTILEILQMSHVLSHLQAFTLALLSLWNTLPRSYSYLFLLDDSCSSFEILTTKNFPETEG